MSLRSYLTLMLIATVACYLALFAVLNFFDPFAGGFLAMLFFYASLFLALTGTLSISGLLFRIFFTKQVLLFKKVVDSFRQAIWFSLLIIITLYLKSANLLVWRNIILLILALVLLEIFFMSYKAKPSARI